MAYIAKRGKSWMVRVYFNDATGKRRSKAKAGFRTKAEARAYGIDVESKLKEGISSIDSNVPFPDYFENWYKTFKKSSISARTQHSYEYTLKILKEYFGAITLEKMNRTLYQNFLNKFGGNHSKQTVAKYIKSHSGESKTSTDISESSSSIVESSSRSESFPQSAKYQAKLNSLNKGTAESVNYDASTNTVTWVGFDDWKTWSDSELQKSMDLLQTMTLRQETNYGISNVHIVVQLPDGTAIAKNSETDMDLQFIK